MAHRFSFNFLYRLLYGTLFVLLGALALTSSISPFSSWILVLACFLAQFFALREFYAIFSNRYDLEIYKTPVYILSFLLYASHYLYPQSPTSFPLLFIFLTLFITSLYHFKHIDRSLASMAATVLGAVYVTLPLMYSIDLAFTKDSLFKGSLFNNESVIAPFWLLATLVSTKGSDVAAYCVGKTWGKTPLAPALSPKKTIEGAVGGLIGSVIGFGSVVYFLYPHELTLYKGFIYTVLAIFIGAISQVSDLIESLFKRDGKVKDSSTSIPGLGGMLDIVDSLIFSLPFVYYVLFFFKASL